jgi:RNA polymerase sigma-70 factor, ECF subfamily
LCGSGNFLSFRDITLCEGLSQNECKNGRGGRSHIGGCEGEAVSDGEARRGGISGFDAGESDEQLIAAFARGRADAFSELFMRHRQAVFGFFCRRMADRAQAEELTQETFIVLLRVQERYEATALFRTYLYAVAYKILRAHRRKVAFRAFFSGSAEGREPAAESGMDAGIAMREAVGKLDRMDREIVLLREFEELSYAEIAAVLRVPVNTVRSRLFRARQALRDLLATPAVKATTELKNAEEHA